MQGPLSIAWPKGRRDPGRDAAVRLGGSEGVYSREQQQNQSRLAARILELARDGILIHLRFLDAALSRLRPVERPGLLGAATDSAALYYDPLFLLLQCREEPNFGARLYLHTLLHCIFYHSFQYDKVDGALWDLAADIAVENTILELGLSFLGLGTDEEARAALEELSGRIGALTAERVYRCFREDPPSQEEGRRLRFLFERDSHALWKREDAQELVLTEEQWKKLSERVKADLKSFSKGKTNSESLEKNLAEATKDRYDYAKLLRRFTVTGEEVSVNEEEFDYIYYTYGLSRYGNMPLVEPLEYRDVKKVREFVIALDTSASCRGALVRAFLRQTYSILMETEHFFQKVNVHILQCDSEVRSDVKITCEEEFGAFLQKGELQGFGSTDFRPVFSYVEELQQKGEFENLKGLIYFTDGYGVYPERMPGYDVIFAFLREDDRQPEVPPWAIRVVLEEEALERQEG